MSKAIEKYKPEPDHAPTKAPGMALVTMEDFKGFAKACYYSGLFDNKEPLNACVSKAVVAMQYGAELGLGPMQSLTGINVMKGKPELSAGLMACLVKSSDHYNYRVTEHTDQRCVIQFYENGESCGESSFSMEDAAQQELIGRNQNWRKVPRNMLFARAISNGAKWFCADALNGSAYVTGEIAEATGSEPTAPLIVESTTVEPAASPMVTPRERPPKAKKVEPEPEPFADADAYNNSDDDDIALPE